MKYLAQITVLFFEIHVLFYFSVTLVFIGLYEVKC